MARTGVFLKVRGDVNVALWKASEKSVETFLVFSQLALGIHALC